MSIELEGLTKCFGDVLAVDDLSAVARPGQVTALLGPNGAGKTTTLRMLLGLVAPSSGTATFGGRRYDDLPDPVRQVGAVLEASGYHPGRTGLDHLRILATASRLPHDAPERVLAETGLAADARRRVGGFSLGMRQRLGIAAAMLGDPSGARPGRADERPRPAGRAVAAWVHPRARGRRSHGAPVQPCPE